MPFGFLPLQTAAALKDRAAPASSGPQASAEDPAILYSRVAAQGDTVRELKARKATKEEVDAAVQKLLALKAEYKEKTGQEYKPGSPPAAGPPRATSQAASSTLSAQALYEAVAAQGEAVRKLKAEKAPKVSALSWVKFTVELSSGFLGHRMLGGLCLQCQKLVLIQLWAELRRSELEGALQGGW